MTSTAAVEASSSTSAGRAQVVRALVARDYAILRSYRFAFGLDVVFGLIELLVYFFISRTFGDAGAARLGAAPSYFAFVVVGIVLTAVVSAASSGVAFRLREEQLTGTLEMLVAQPVRAADLAVGMAGFPFAFAIGRAALYLLVAAALPGFGLSGASWAGFVVILLLSGAALSGLGIALAGVLVVYKRGQTVAGLLSIAMGFLGGAFFPISVLPSWLEPVAWIVPMRYAFDGLRKAVYGGGGWLLDAGALAGFAAVGVPLGLLVFRFALRHALRNGSIAQY